MVNQKKKSKETKSGEPAAIPFQQTAADRARASEDLFKALEQIVFCVDEYAIVLLDRHGIIQTWNSGAEKLIGFTAGDIIGKSSQMFYSREDRDAGLPTRLLDQATREGKANHEGWRVRKDGSRFWGSITITALHDPNGELRGFLKIARDLSDKKSAEEKLQNLIEELHQKNDELKRSELRYHQMVAEIEDYAIVLLDKHGRICDWNKGAEKLKGYTSGEIVGRNNRLFYPMEDKESRLPEKLLEEARVKGSVNHEGWRIRKDGSRFWASVVITALHGENNEIIGFSKVTRDLSEWKAAEDRLNAFTEELRQKNEQLRQSELRYQRMVAEVQDYAIILLDEQGHIQNWNSGVERIKGYLAEEVIGKSFRMFYTEDDRLSGLPERLLDHAREHGRVSYEGWRVKKNGTRFWGNVVLTALHDPNGQVIGFSKVTRDLTERKLSDDNLRANAAQLDLKNQALERLNAELSSFTYVASHDLNEPLRKILVYADRVIQRGSATANDLDDLKKIHDSASRMQKLIRDLLAYSAVTTSPVDWEVTDLNKVLEDVRSDLEIAITKKKAAIQAGPLPVISAIPFQIHQLFFNLVANSIKFSKTDTPPTIKIEHRTIKVPEIPLENFTPSRSKYHQITFRDNGIGFDQKYADQIFQPFQRLHDKMRYAGTGIGLAIVQKIVNNHNGIISAEGEPGQGATFNVYLPC